MRIFFEETIPSETFSLSPETAKHVTQVLRMKEGEHCLLTDGNGIKATVQISTISKRTCEVRVLKKEEITNSNPDIHLAISFTKNNARMEWLLEKITEIGVRSIYPIITNRSERKEIKAERFNKKLISAMLQSQQYHLPIIHEPVYFNEFVSIKYDNKFIAHCESSINRKQLNKSTKNNSTIIAIGPEGDFTIEEIEQALQQNFKSVSLGKNRLRTETAGLVAVTLLHQNVQQSNEI
jgi:16S rRNA (uracil1498-N3)-methyltransferase